MPHCIDLEVRRGNQRVPFDLLVDVAKGMLHLDITNLSDPALAEGLEVGSGVVKLIYVDEARWVWRIRLLFLQIR